MTNRAETNTRYEIGDNTCDRCGKRKATVIWANDTLHYVHDSYEYRCDICCVEEQLEFAKEQVKRIPKLEEKLEELLSNDTGTNK
jgi:hypothetical protein